eukprot:1479780-Karenia_brevis.AAC.1
MMPSPDKSQLKRRGFAEETRIRLMRSSFLTCQPMHHQFSLMQLENFAGLKDFSSQALSEHSEGLCQEKEFSSQALFEHSEGFRHEKDFSSQAPFEHSEGLCHEKDFNSQAFVVHSEGCSHEKDTPCGPFATAEHASPRDATHVMETKISFNAAITAREEQHVQVEKDQ